MTSARGFTLIEMLVVIAILGVALGLAAGAAPRRGGGLDLAAAAQELGRAMRLARVRAIASGRPMLFTPAAGGRGYTIDGVTRPLPPNTQLAMGGAAAIRFDPAGGASGGDLRIAGAARVMQLRVNWVTGRVTIQEIP